MTEISIAEAKNQLTRLIRAAENGKPVHITRRGKPVAVLLSEDEYARLLQGRKHDNFWNLIVEMRSDPEFQAVDWTPEEIASWRDRELAPDFEWPE